MTEESPKNILIMDDELLVVRFLERLLEPEGYRITTAVDGKKGLQTFRADPADLVVVDLFMPERDGLEVIGELRKKYPEVPILVISGGGKVSVDLLPVPRSLGADRVLQKPLEVDEVLTAVGELLGA